MKREQFSHSLMIILEDLKRDIVRVAADGEDASEESVLSHD